MSLNEEIRKYREGTDIFLSLASSLTPLQLDVVVDDEWTPRQIIHHVADSEAQSYARLRRLIAEPGTLIQGYDEAAWGESETLGYTELPITYPLAVFAAVRGSTLEIMQRLTEDQLSHAGTHSESGSYDVNTWISNYIAHPFDHADQIRRQISST
jgi:hypothetical protein